MKLDFSNLVGFDWDQGNLEHIRKHQVEMLECEEIFSNTPLFVNNDEAHSQTEERFRVYGTTNKNRLLTLIFTIRDSKIRVISARNQSKKERQEFSKSRR